MRRSLIPNTPQTETEPGLTLKHLAVRKLAKSQAEYHANNPEARADKLKTLAEDADIADGCSARSTNRHVNPSPDEIREACLKLQATWTDREARRRCGEDPDAAYEIPEHGRGTARKGANSSST